MQSAMLKRSDSVNKRWSAQAGSGVSRENSIVSNRSGYEGSRPAMGIVSPIRDHRPGSLSRDGSPVSSSRPGSSHSNVTLTQSGMESGRSNGVTLTAGIKPEFNENAFAKPALPSLKRSPSINNGQEGADDQALDSNTPASPSKKWSPTKASWLENAIKKPDSPKPRIIAPTQPSWMTNRTKAKQEQESIEHDKSRGVEETATIGLLRSPPPDTHVKPHSLPVLPKTPSVEVLAESSVGKPESVDGVKDVNLEPKKIPGPGNQSGSRQLTTLTPTGEPSPARKEIKTIRRDNPTLSPILTDHAKVELRVGSPSTTEPVSQTPPNKDFRSNLKSRRASVGKDSKEEIEFKNVFGKLKRTQTQNYIAPDELKDNILRGKAGLAATGGPKKTEHKDEFKESLLKQREAIKAGISPKVPLKPSGKSFSNDRQSPVPEAIVKKEGLIRSKSGLEAGDFKLRSERDIPVRDKENNVEKKHGKEKPKNFPDRQITPRQNEVAADGRLAEPFTSSLASLLSRGPSPLLGVAKPSAPKPSSLVANDGLSSITAGEAGTGGPALIHMTKTRARGPKRRLPVTEKQSDIVDEGASSFSKSVEIEPPMLPAQESSKGDRSLVSSQVRDRSAPRPLASISNNNNRKPSQPFTPRKPSTNVTPLVETKPTSPNSKPPVKAWSTTPATSFPPIKPKPAISTDVSATKRSVPSDRPKQDLVEKPVQVGEPLPKAATHVPVPKKDQATPEANSKTPGSFKVGAATWAKPLALDLASPTGTNFPIKSLSRRAENVSLAKVSTEDEGKAKQIGLGIKTTSEESQRKAPLDRNLPSPPLQSPQLSPSPKSPPLPGKKPASIGKRILSVRSLSQGTSQTENSAKSSAPLVSIVLSSYIGEIPSSCPNISIGTQTVLASSSSSSGSNKIKTLRKQIWEITGHGKSIPVPSHQEHILFEDSLYLCTHVFGTLTGTRTTEVYLWCGSGVAESAADDAQIFARKVAKEHSGKLFILQQGTETSNFFQALGGIVITRRGSSSRGESPSKSAATYMLCGRRHVGQIAFDEVDYSTRSLCKAFPFLISTRFGKLYLWKGAGSGVDELGCARLIGMDLGLAGEIEEVDDGREPDGFWESLPGGKNGAMTGFQHWHLRPGCEKYVTRLFGIDVEPSRPKSSSSFTWRRRESAPQEESAHLVARVREITPFTQNDLARDGIYVLDAFFEVFV